MSSGGHGGAPTGAAGGEGAGGAAAAGGAGGGGKNAAAAAMRHIANESSIEYFAAGVCGLLGIFILAHLGRRAYRSATGSSGTSRLRTVAKPVVVASR